MRNRTLTTFSARLALVCGVSFAFAPAFADQTLSAPNYEHLTEAQRLLAAGRYQQALRDLNALLEDVQGQAYDEAVVLQTMGYAHLKDGQRASAIQAFEQALARHALPDEPRHTVQGLLGRLYAADKQYEKARKMLEEWLAARSEHPNISDYVTLASVYAQLKAYDEGIGTIGKAIALNPKPERAHYQLLLAMQLQSKRYHKAAQTLSKMLGVWPNERELWTQLANTYLYTGQDKKAYTTLKRAYQKGLLNEQSQLVNLAKLGMAVGRPSDAARTLAKGLENGTIESSRAHWQLLASAWDQANEIENAVAVYDTVAQFGNAGQAHLRQAELCLRQSDWTHVLGYIEQALNAGGLSSPGRAYLLRGVAHTRLEEFGAGLAALNQARKYDETAGEAARWVAYVHQRKERSQ